MGRLGVRPAPLHGYATTSYTVAKAIELYQNEYAVGFPFEERPAGRPARTTPLYPVLKAKGAHFAARNGWERAAFSTHRHGRGADAHPAPRPQLERSRPRRGPGRPRGRRRDRPWRLLQVHAGGPGAAAMLDRLLCSRLPKVGRIGLCYALDAKGGVVSEFTVTAGRGPLLPGLRQHRRMARRGSPARRVAHDGSARLECLHGRLGTLVIAGPAAREVLQQVTPADLSNAAFPWLSAREIELGFGRALALRVNYVGELGWELHLPMEQLLPAYEAVMAAGATRGIRDVGIYAIESMRLDKCYRSWKQDLETGFSPSRPASTGSSTSPSPTSSARRPPGRARARRAPAPGAADPGRAGRGRRAVLRAGACRRRAGRPRDLGLLELHARAQRGAGLCRADLAAPGSKVEVEIFGRRVPATVGAEPLYDPENARLRA